MNTLETDPQKRAIYDRSGGDPESRFGGMSSSGPSSGFQTSPFSDGELSPEDLFNMFFGGGTGMAFSTGPGDIPCRVYEPNARSNSHPQYSLPALVPGVSAQPAFIHHAHEHKSSNRNKLLRGLSSSSFSLSLSYLRSPSSLLSRTCFLQPPCQIHAFHSSHPRDSICRGRRRDLAYSIMSTRPSSLAIP
jgi:hypothetical protein